MHVLLFVLAAILIGRAAVSQNGSSLWLPAYELGHAPMPYQGRYLMVPVLRWAAASPTMQHAARLLSHSSRSSEELTVQAVDALCLILMGGITVRLRRCFAPATMFPWLAPALLLWITACTYVIRYEQAIYFPYDFVSALLFAVGVLTCVEYRPVLFVATVLIGSYNRETAVFLLPIWLACNVRKHRAGALLATLAGLAACVVARLQISHWVHTTRSGLTIPWRVNLLLLLPHHLPQVLSVGGFLCILMWLRRDLIRDSGLRMVWLGTVPFLISLVLAGWWNETRIFGELDVLIAVTAAAQFEQYLREEQGLLPAETREQGG